MYVPEKSVSNRSEKVKKELLRFVSEKLVSGDFYSRLTYVPMITVTKIDITPNMRQAFIYFRNFDKNKVDDVLKFLTRISGELSKQWSKVATSKYTPSFEFRIDDETEEERRMEEIFNNIRRKDL